MKATNDELQKSVSLFTKSTIKTGTKDATELLIRTGGNVYILMKVR
jgi:hypothetical protein